jgi:polysaccharide export outer membrane protein
MTNKTAFLSLIVSLLVISLQEASIAQTGIQQMPNNSGGNPSALAADQSTIEKAAVMRNSALMAVPEDFPKLKLGPGFLVSLNVLDDPDFTGEFRIDEQGNIVVPILGPIHVGGETASEAGVQIKDKLLEDKILKDPQVHLNVLEYTAPEVTIVGEVTSPGKYPLLTPRKLVDVLALAGGPTLLAGNVVQISRNDGSAEPLLIHYSRSANPNTIENVVVHPGETVLVKRAGIVYVLGAVNRPGGYVMQEEGSLNLLQAISLANGTAISASTGTVYLIRKNPDGTEVDIALPYKKISRGKYSDIQLHATDVLYVPTSAVKSILTNSQAVLASAASASIYAAAVY